MLQRITACTAQGSDQVPLRMFAVFTYLPACSALREAAEVLTEAQELARQQTLSDLMSSWSADSAVQQQQQSLSTSASSSTASSAASSATNPTTQQTDAAAAASGTGQVSSAAALEAFWCEQGLSQSEAQQLLKEVQADPQLAASCCDTQVCARTCLVQWLPRCTPCLMRLACQPRHPSIC